MAENMGGMPDEDDEDAYDQIDHLPDVAVSRDFNHAEPVLVEAFKRLKGAYEKRFPSRQVICTCTYRSVSEQQRLYKQGRYGNKGQIVTYLDGKQKKSKHNYFPSRALDVAIFEGGKITWDESLFYPLGAILKADKIDLVWGGEFKHPDFPHLEMKD